MEKKPLSKSIYSRLHALRWSAAFVVLCGHIEMVVKWLTGMSIWPMAYQMAHLAVMAFFVLSGFIISHVAYKTSDLSGYMQERVTRIYSVLVPAVFLTVILDTIGAKIAPHFYNIYATSNNFLFRLLVNLFGLQGWQGHRIQFGTNSPLWSIGYEMFFYVASGLLFYKVIKSNQAIKYRLIWLLVTGVLMMAAGSKMVLYLFIWGVGALAYHVRIRYCFSKFCFVLSSAICFVSFVLVPPGYWQDLIFSFGLFGFIISPDGRGQLAQFNELIANFSTHYTQRIYL